MRRLTLVLTMSLLALAACGKTVNEPRQAVIDRLGAMPSDANVMHLARQVPHAVFRSQLSAEGVDWIFSIGGNDICRFSAKVTEAGENASRVSTAMEELGDEQEIYLCNVARITGEESVTATLEGRPANVEAVSAQLNQYLVTNMGAVQDTVSRRMDEMAPPAGDECQSGDAEARKSCRRFMRAREREMREQGFANPNP
jgi:hypothetical protein